ncbi:hypothetical protein BC828DRAFT_391802 [Blastocladiella britannica]|nr:hypothetical protein BC828DRAFT_391802 [Blastocladiella britannica]
MTKDRPQLVNQPCTRCGSARRISRNCLRRDPKPCHNCQSLDHLAHKCPRAPERIQECYNFKEPGHISRDCRN